MVKMIMVTGNKRKFEEAKTMLKGHDLSLHYLDLQEIQGSSEEIVKFKAKEAFRLLKVPCFVEDVSFGFRAWNWLPGPYIKDFLNEMGVEALPGLLCSEDKTAKATCTIGYAKSEDVIEIFEGEVLGKITSTGADNGFGFDRFFIPDGFDKRFSEMSIEEKNKNSHRGKALEKFRTFLGD